jgi:hypothetical protein
LFISFAKNKKELNLKEQKKKRITTRKRTKENNKKRMTKLKY